MGRPPRLDPLSGMLMVFALALPLALASSVPEDTAKSGGQPRRTTDGQVRRVPEATGQSDRSDEVNSLAEDEFLNSEIGGFDAADSSFLQGGKTSGDSGATSGEPQGVSGGSLGLPTSTLSRKIRASPEEAAVMDSEVQAFARRHSRGSSYAAGGTKEMGSMPSRMSMNSGASDDSVHKITRSEFMNTLHMAGRQAVGVAIDGMVKGVDPERDMKEQPKDSGATDISKTDRGPDAQKKEEEAKENAVEDPDPKANSPGHDRRILGLSTNGSIIHNPDDPMKLEWYPNTISLTGTLPDKIQDLQMSVVRQQQFARKAFSESVKYRQMIRDLTSELAKYKESSQRFRAQVYERESDRSDDIKSSLQFSSGGTEKQPGPAQGHDTYVKMALNREKQKLAAQKRTDSLAADDDEDNDEDEDKGDDKSSSLLQTSAHNHTA
jgi:hypothetical protein